MCGRFANALYPDEVRRLLAAAAAASRQQDALGALGDTEVAVREPVPQASPHIRPTQRIMVTCATEDGLIVTGARWGLVPIWSKAVGTRPLINARAETVTQKPSFREGAKKRRVLIPATSYFEWLTDAEGAKQPHRIARPGGEVLWLAGVAAWWKDPDAPEPPADAPEEASPWMFSTAIITRAAYDEVAWVHDRSPLVVPDEWVGPWLDRDVTDPGAVDGLMSAMPEPELVAEPTTLP